MTNSEQELKPIGWAEKDKYGDYIIDCLWSDKETAENKGITVYPIYDRPTPAPDDAALDALERFVMDALRLMPIRNDSDIRADRSTIRAALTNATCK